jgi:phage major head subunit gpT-like protein
MPNKLLESNKKTIQRVLTNSKEIKKYRESFKRKFKFDPFDKEKLPVDSHGFSWSAVHEKISTKFREADTSSAFVQVLRAGVQNIVNSAYETVPTTFEEWVTVVQSSKSTEPYAPLHGLTFPGEVGAQEKYPELRADGLDIKLKNRKYGSIYAAEYELLEDDQTGQFNKQAGMMGEYMKLLTEVLVYGKLASVTGMKYLNLKIRQSETKPSDEANYPWSTSLQGGGSNRPGTFGTFNQTNIQNAIIALMGQKNLLGQLMQVSPNRLLISPKFTFDASVLLNSAYYPSGAAAAGQTGGAFAQNPIKGIADLTVSRYMFDNTGTVNPQSKAWYMIDDSKPWFVLQLREAATVYQEAQNAGASFETDVTRFKVRGRMNADHIDPRFAWQGNDGSV